MFQITKNHIAPETIKENLTSPASGAVVTFEGRVRNTNNGKRVEALEYSAYDRLAENVGDQILEEARSKFDVQEAVMVHRVGHLELTESSIFIAIASAHRKPAFRACGWVIDEVKKRLPVWKKEIYKDGSETWINAPQQPAEPKRQNPEQ